MTSSASSRGHKNNISFLVLPRYSCIWWVLKRCHRVQNGVELGLVGLSWMYVRLSKFSQKSLEVNCLLFSINGNSVASLLFEV